MSAEVPALIQAFNRSPSSAASMTQTWRPTRRNWPISADPEVTSRDRTSMITRFGPPFDPTFDLWFPGHDVHRGKSVCLEGAGQGTGQQIAAGDQDPSRDSQWLGPPLGHDAHDFCPLLALVRRWKLRVDGWRQAALSARQRVNLSAEPSMPMCGGFETMLAKRASKLPPSAPSQRECRFRPRSLWTTATNSVHRSLHRPAGRMISGPLQWGQSCLGRMAFVRTAGVSRGIFE